MLIRWEDRDWNFGVLDLTNRQAEAMETGLKMSLAEFYDLFEGDEENGFDAARPHFLKFMTFLYWLMLDQNGVKVSITDVEFPVLRFAEAVVSGMAAEAAAQPAPANGEVKPGPTRPPGASPRSRAPSSRSRKKAPAAAGSPDG